MGRLTFPIVFDHDDLQKMVNEKIAELKAQFIPKADYEARLKADMVAMLEEIESMFWELTKNKYDMQILYEKADDFEADFNSFIQQKINALKENDNGFNEKTSN